jgi:plasmid maintenance system antidote protein VapI
MTQSDVAEAIGTTRTSVSNFLAGKQTFGMDVTLRLIDWLGIWEAPDGR